MKRILKRTAVALLLVIPLVIVTLAAGIATAWLKPKWVLTDERQQWLFDRFAASLFTQKPEHLGLEILPNGWFGKKIKIELSPFCLKTPKSCFEKTHVEFAFRFVSWKKIRLDEIGPVEVLNRFITLPESSKTQPKTEPGFSIWDHLEIPADLTIRQLRVESPQITLPGKNPLVGAVSIQGEDSSRLQIDASAKNAEGLQLKAQIATGFTYGEKNDFHAKLEAQNGPDGWKIDGALDGSVLWTRLSADLRGGLSIKRMIPWVDTLSVKNLVIHRDQTLKLSADLETRLEPRLNWEARVSALPKVKFRTDLTGKLNVVEKNDSYQYQVRVGPLSQKGIDLTAILEGGFPFPKGLEYRYGLQRALVKLDVPDFQKLVRHLRTTSSAIPAPFSALKGSIHLQAGNEDANLEHDTLPLQLITALDSSEQAVKTQSNGTLVFDPHTKRIRVNGGTRIELVRFTLPDLDLLTPQPALANDSRIVSLKKLKKEEKKEVEEKELDPSQAKFDFTWKVTTAPSGIQVNYPVFHPYAPAQVSWNVGVAHNQSENDGEIDLLPFDVEYLNRKAHVDHLRYYLKKGEKIFHYDGKLTIPKTDYTLTVVVFDESGKPKVEFSSEPPLSQDNIISLLLFNQTTNELTPDESNSVANTQAAVTNRALGLFSIWALSSTPIEAVNFNPTTKVYSARVKLANGLTATIGTDWENTQEVALRKRIGRNWVLSTMVQTDKETNTESKKTLLEWFKRF